MKFLLLVCAGRDVHGDRRAAPATRSSEWWTRTSNGAAYRVEGDRLRGIGDATMVRDSGRLIIDGPFAETKERIAGYDVLDCADLAEAVEIAVEHPVARFGAIEVRPFWSE